MLVLDAAREFDEPEGAYIGVPREEELMAAAAIAALPAGAAAARGRTRAMRKILDVTQPVFSETLGGKAVTTISRREKELRDIATSTRS